MSDDVPEHLEGEMHSWLKRTFLQFRELELRLLLEGLQTSLYDQAANLSEPAGVKGSTTT
jgi:hypothetical protein